jgi:hypothetical protein
MSFTMRRSQTRPLGSLIVPLVTPICQKRGFISATIIVDWSLIVGHEFQRFCQPEKLIFPHKQRSAGCLYVRTTSSMAPEIAYLEPTILEKINCYFGYQAVSKIIIRQGPILTKERSPAKSAPLPPVEILEGVRAQVCEIKNDALKESLMKLGTMVMMKK